MMTDDEREKTKVVLLKIMDLEPLSTADFERFINFLDRFPINADVSDQAKWAALQVRFRSVIHERFMPKGPQ